MYEIEICKGSDREFDNMEREQENLERLKFSVVFYFQNSKCFDQIMVVQQFIVIYEKKLPVLYVSKRFCLRKSDGRRLTLSEKNKGLFSTKREDIFKKLIHQLIRLI